MTWIRRAALAGALVAAVALSVSAPPQGPTRRVGEVMPERDKPPMTDTLLPRLVWMSVGALGASCLMHRSRVA